MLRPLLRTTTRATRPQAFHRLSPHVRSRFISSKPPARRSRSWKSSAARWGLAAAGIYWYSTTAIFAEEPTYLNSTLSQTATEDEPLPTLDTIASARKQRLATAPSAPTALDAPSPSTSPDLSMAASMAATEGAASPASTSKTPSQPAQSAQEVSPQTIATPAAPGAATGSPAELEEEAEGEGAFNPETGEINWDCPCLGGMAHGPCGPEFREAFSCFVYSEQEPKGIDCIEKFKGMQDCFRSHPDVYGAELTDEIDDEDHEATQNATSQTPPSNASTGNSETEKAAKAAPETKVAQPAGSDDEIQARRERSKAASQQVAQDYSAGDSDDKVIPKAWHDAKGDNEQKEK